MGFCRRTFWILVLFSLFIASGASTQAEPQFRLGVVLSVGGLGDKSFNDAAYVGIQALRQRPDVLIDVVEPADVQGIEGALSYLAAKRLDLIVAIGLFANDAIRTIAPRHPDLRFALIDSVVSAPNVLSIMFNEEQGSFYAGALAGLLSKSNKVGFLGGMVSPVIQAFERGFKAGIGFVNPAVEVLVEYAGDTPQAFQNPDLGRKIGLKMGSAGADIIYHAAGGTGLGLINAARGGGFLVIGVDSDQSTVIPGRIAASMVKRLDVALLKAFQLVQTGSFRGGVLTLGLLDNGVELVLSRFNRDLFTPLLQERLQQVNTFLLHQPETGSNTTSSPPSAGE